MSKISGENLRAGMSLEQVAAVVGDAAVFRYVSGHIATGQGMNRGQWQEHGEGTIFGKTETEPPFDWSISADRGLANLRVGSLLTIKDFSDMLPQTFQLKARPRTY